MLLTEQEAKDKWCPMTRVIMLTPDGIPASMPFNRTLQADGKVLAREAAGEVTLTLPEAAQCGGANCMMWRWFDKPSFKEGSDHKLAERRGFCGLAMNPHTYQ